MTRFFQIAACVVLLLGSAQADGADVYALLHEGNPAKAYEVAVRKHRDHAGEYTAEVELAAAEISYFRYADGEERLDRLVVAHPDEAEPLRLQASLHFTTARREEAWRYLDQALALQPENETLLAMRDQQQRLDTMLAPRSVDSRAPAPRAVALLFEDIRQGAPNDIIIGRFVKGFGGISHQQFDDFLRGFREASNVPGGSRMALIGYGFGESERDDAGDTVIATSLVMRSTFGKNAAEKIGESAALAGMFAGFAHSLADLSPEERETVIARMVGYEVDTIVPLEVTVSAGAPERIKEIRVVRGAALSSVLGAMRGLQKEHDEMEQVADKAVGALKFLAVCGAIGILVTLMRRHDRAQRRSRR
jgi:hypothetical protein